MSSSERASGGAPELTLVVPCYNEASHLGESVRRVLEVLDGSRLDYELVFVDDCSQDETRGVIEELCMESARCRFIFHEKNRGRGAAFKTGFAASQGRITGFVDIDLEVAAHYIPPLATWINEHDYDVASGRRYYLARQTGGLHRIILSFAYRALCGFLLSTTVEDTESGYKFFKRSTASDIVLASEADGWFWDTEVMAMADLHNLAIHEMPVLFLRRHDKASTVRIIPDSIAYLRELHRFRGRAGLAMLDRSPIYWTRRGYDFVMKLLYRGELDAIAGRVGAAIPEGASVVDVCCGTAHLYFSQLKGGGVDYLGLDANGHFVMALRRLGVGARLFDVRHEEVPEADYVVMCSSLYHFREHESEIFGKLERSARRGVIISEPVQNLSSHTFAPLAALANALTNPGTGGDHSFRYDAESFRRFAESHGATRIELDADSRNALAVFEKDTAGAAD